VADKYRSHDEVRPKSMSSFLARLEFKTLDNIEEFTDDSSIRTPAK